VSTEFDIYGFYYYYYSCNVDIQFKDGWHSLNRIVPTKVFLFFEHKSVNLVVFDKKFQITKIS